MVNVLGINFKIKQCTFFYKGMEFLSLNIV